MPSPQFPQLPAGTPLLRRLDRREEILHQRPISAAWKTNQLVRLVPQRHQKDPELTLLLIFVDIRQEIVQQLVDRSP